jgi:hypothetical protein
MKRLSRAGRISEIKQVLYWHSKRRPKQAVTVGFIARKMGLKSSTYLKNLLKEICAGDNGYEVLSAGDHHVYRFMPYEQTSFLDRIPVIKNKGIEIPADHKSMEGQL